MHSYIYIYIYVYIHTYVEREREKDNDNYKCLNKYMNNQKCKTMIHEYIIFILILIMIILVLIPEPFRRAGQEGCSKRITIK